MPRLTLFYRLTPSDMWAMTPRELWRYIGFINEAGAPHGP